MGAFEVKVMLHDVELEEFIRQAVAEELSPEARYVALRICDEIPELLPEP